MSVVRHAHVDGRAMCDGEFDACAGAPRKSAITKVLVARDHVGHQSATDAGHGGKTAYSDEAVAIGAQSPKRIRNLRAHPKRENPICRGRVHLHSASRRGGKTNGMTFMTIVEPSRLHTKRHTTGLIESHTKVPLRATGLADLLLETAEWTTKVGGHTKVPAGRRACERVGWRGGLLGSERGGKYEEGDNDSTIRHLDIRVLGWSTREINVHRDRSFHAAKTDPANTVAIAARDSFASCVSFLSPRKDVGESLCPASTSTES
jgi:hypothetical protein